MVDYCPEMSVTAFQHQIEPPRVMVHSQEYAQHQWIHLNAVHHQGSGTGMVDSAPVMKREVEDLPHGCHRKSHYCQL